MGNIVKVSEVTAKRSIKGGICCMLKDRTTTRSSALLGMREIRGNKYRSFKA